MGAKLLAFCRIRTHSFCVREMWIIFQWPYSLITYWNNQRTQEWISGSRGVLLAAPGAPNKDSQNVSTFSSGTYLLPLLPNTKMELNLHYQDELPITIYIGQESFYLLIFELLESHNFQV